MGAAMQDGFCLAFLHCLFSKVSSIGLAVRMHSGIGWSRVVGQSDGDSGAGFCFSFLHCVFSKVSSINLPV